MCKELNISPESLKNSDAVIADRHMHLLGGGAGISLSPGISLLDLVCRDSRSTEKLLVLGDNTSEVLKIYVDGIPMEMEVCMTGGCYRLFSPCAVSLNSDRMNELTVLTSSSFMWKLPNNIRTIASSYNSLLRGNVVESVDIGDASMLMRHVMAVADRIRHVMRESSASITMGGVPVIKYSEKDFSRVVMISLAAANLMSGDRIRENRCNVCEHIAYFEVVFDTTLPAGVMELITSGELDNYSFMSEYGNIFLTLCYLRHVARQYGYSVTVNSDDRGTVLTVAFPIIKNAEASMVFRELEHEQWIETLATDLLGEARNDI